MSDLTPQVPGQAPDEEAKPKTKAKAVAKNDAPGLPDASSIDPTKIARSVLTRTGWVVPVKAGK